MFTKIMKWLSITALLVGLLLRSSTAYLIALEFVVCVSALLIVTQMARAGKYLWAAGFLVIAVFFNPVAPIALSRKSFIWVDWVCLAAFLLSLAVVKKQPTLSMPSITYRTPGSESL